ncbi:MAG TPA: glycine--tRNA ligase [Phycisphaerales bacterium]|nr:glycine--tRNA ligase [Phycisphaerales bacterium]
MSTPEQTTAGNQNANTAKSGGVKSMDEIVALCRRRGFIFQSSEIYGGINGFWDYGPLGAQLKRNLKEAWWQDIVQQELSGPDGKPVDIVGLDSTIIMNPKVWVASGHAAGFNDPMVDDKETKQRFRADHLIGLYQAYNVHTARERELLDQATSHIADPMNSILPLRTLVASSIGEAVDLLFSDKKLRQSIGIRKFVPSSNAADPDDDTTAALVDFGSGEQYVTIDTVPVRTLELHYESVVSPFTGKTGTLTKPRQFNLMFETFIGALQDEDSKAWLRPETAQGIFVNFWNVIDSTRVRVPFGIAQQGKAFRNEVTPRNFTFRSREFEQMEIEFFIPPLEACRAGEPTPTDWYKFWRDLRFRWWQSIGLAGDNLQLREHEKDELAHYAKEGAGTSDIEYRFPFTAPGFGELEGVAHRADFDLKAHASACGKGDKMKYFDQDLQVELQGAGKSKEEIQQKSRYFPHVIEPSAGADRGTLALLCEAYTPDESRASKVYMKFHPRMAPVKAGIFPLVNKDAMPETAERLYKQLRKKWVVEYDPKQTIGKRYARMDEAGTPYCFTIDGDTLTNQTVTVRDRDSQTQERIAIDQVEAYLTRRLG